MTPLCTALLSTCTLTCAATTTVRDGAIEIGSRGAVGASVRFAESGCEIRHPLYTEPSLPGKGLKLRGPDPGHASSLSAYSYSSHTAVNGTSQDTPRGRGGFRVQLCKLYILTFDPAQVPLGSTIPRYSLHVGTRFGLCRPAQPHAAAAGPRISTPIATSHPHRRSSQRRSNRLIERPRSRTCRVSPAHLCPTSQVRAAT